MSPIKQRHGFEVGMLTRLESADGGPLVSRTQRPVDDRDSLLHRVPSSCFDTCVTAPETRPLPAIKHAHQPIDGGVRRGGGRGDSPAHRPRADRPLRFPGRAPPVALPRTLLRCLSVTGRYSSPRHTQKANRLILDLLKITCDTKITNTYSDFMQLNQLTTNVQHAHSRELGPNYGQTIADIRKFPHYAFYPPFHTIFPQFPFHILPSMFRSSAFYQEPYNAHVTP